MAKLLVLLIKKGIVKSKFRDNEFVYQKRFEEFHIALKSFEYTKFKDFEEEVTQLNEDEVIALAKEDFLSGGRKLKLV